VAATATSPRTKATHAPGRPKNTNKNQGEDGRGNRADCSRREIGTMLPQSVEYGSRKQRRHGSREQVGRHPADRTYRARIACAQHPGDNQVRSGKGAKRQRDADAAMAETEARTSRFSPAPDCAERAIRGMTTLNPIFTKFLRISTKRTAAA